MLRGLHLRLHLSRPAFQGSLLAAALAASVALSAQAPPTQSPAPIDQKPCAESLAGPCVPTRASRKEADKLYKAGQRQQEKQEFRQAFDSFSKAAKLAPDSFVYVSAREMVRQALVSQLIRQGNQEMQDDRRLQALKAFQQALEIDPGNAFARQRVYDSMPPLPAVRIQVSPGIELIQLKPTAGRRNVSVQGPASVALEALAKAYGLTAFVDTSVPARQVNLKLENATWAEAVDVLCRMTKTFWTPLAPNQVLFALDDDSTRRVLQRVGLATFYLSTSTPQELNDLTNTLRVLFDIRYIVADPAQGTITIRAAQPIVEAASQFIEQLDAKRPQVMIDVHVYAVAQDLTKDIGVNIPNSFTIFNVPTEAQKLLGGRSIQDVINELIANGGINQAATSGIAGLLAQALGGGGSSILTQPFLTFGGGKTLTGITLPGTSIKLSADESMMQTLQNVSVRASQGNPAVIKIGQRYPILNATSAPIYNNPAIARVIGNGSYLSPFPSVSYEDLGIDLKATPRVSRTGVVTVDFEMQVRALQGTSVNGVPVLSNREFKGTMSTKDGEPIVIAGLISKSELRSVSGIPGLSQIPLVGKAFTDTKHTNNDDEVLVVMTPRIVNGASAAASPAIALPSFIQR